MGQKAGKESRLKRKEVREFMSLTHFNSDEVRCLYEHFRHISSGVHDDGVIDKEEFTAAMGFQSKFYVDRMFQLFDENGDGAINFTEFLCGLSILSTKGTVGEKVSFSFQIYDFDGDGKISKQELSRMLEATLSETRLHLTADQQRSLVDATFRQVCPADPTATHINFEQYKIMCRDHPRMMAQLCVDVSSIIAGVLKRTGWDPNAGVDDEEDGGGGGGGGGGGEH